MFLENMVGPGFTVRKFKVSQVLLALGPVLHAGTMEDKFFSMKFERLFRVCAKKKRIFDQ
jgi:hypothetical protein